jgi:hypothetical protein
MDFNKGVIEDQSENKIPCGIEGVVSLSNLAYFNGASRIIFWRYTNFDFQRSITFDPLRHTILIQSLLSLLIYYVLSREATTINFIVFCLTRSGLEPTI